MLKKSAIFGILLLVIGSSVLAKILNDRRNERRRAASYRIKYGYEPDECLKRYEEWLRLPAEKRAAMPLQVNGYGQAKTVEQLQVEQRERLMADLDKLAAGQLDGHPYADVLYGENWQEQVRKHTKRQEINEFVLTGSVVCTSIGGITLGLCLIASVARVLIAGVCRLAGASVESDLADNPGSSDQAGGNIKEPPDASFDRAAQASGFTPCISADSAPGDEDSDGRALRNARPPKNRKKIPVVIGEQKTMKREKAPSRPAGRGVSDMVGGSGSEAASQTVLTQRRNDAAVLEESLKAHAKELEKQMEEFKRMYNARQGAPEQSNPLNGTLEDLTEQVSAIREYASAQQERVEKLQDGYDWSIIRTFCLRVIRCIDNLEGRIERLSEENAETKHLEEVRDELIFALESSGIEQFTPELNSPYHGQEKSTEAVKEREDCDDAGKAGTIAKVVRPGYRYFIDESNLKVVRSAQVKLFG
ncbi:MAG: nucleotide exchange factor GrpE [Sedimentisphaerales bacterium]|nr:nucleotide exchange factor GrpE [Sedimentisphaerales bacterium]